MSLNNCFIGKRILVTGAGRGIGRALAIRLHSYGAIVYALSKTPENLSTLKDECPNITTICVDITDWEETRKELSKLEPLNGLINNAAVAQVGTFMTIQPEDFDRSMSTNVKSVINISQIVAEKMISNGKGGSIVNISSTVGLQATACFPVYCTTKAAMEMITKLMAIELGPNKIRVNSINPCFVEGTDMTKGAIELMQACDALRKYQEKMVLEQFFVGMDELLNTILFVLSDMTTMITGESIAIDGGYHIS